MTINQYFDKIYVLNLHKRKERRELMKKRLAFADITNYEFFNATDGESMKRIWESYQKENSFFSNSNYLACAISHLSIYIDALHNNYSRILILEDDVRIKRDINTSFNNYIKLIPDNWSEILYLGFIPLSDDCTKWDYNVFSNNFINSNVFVAKNLWGLFAYGISQQMMREVLNIYTHSFPMELDRYFVSNLQPLNKSYGITPQLFCTEDGISDNSHVNEHGLLQKSIDSRFSSPSEYI